MLNTVVNPEEERSVTAGNIKEPLQLFAEGASTGAEGNITDCTTLLAPHAPVPTAPAGVDPHAAVKTYRASNV